MNAFELRLGDKRMAPNYFFSCEECARDCSSYVPPSGKRPRFCSKSCASIVTNRNPLTRAAMLRTGANHYRWKGDAVSVRGGRSRAKRAFPAIGPCSACGRTKSERHHIDGDTANNKPENIAVLCRRCHMKEDGRLGLASEQMRRIQPVGVAHRWKK